MRNKNKPYLFLFPDLLEDSFLLNRTFLRPTKSLINRRITVQLSGRAPYFVRIRRVFQMCKIKSFITNRKRGNHIRTFFKVKQKVKVKHKKK